MTGSSDFLLPMMGVRPRGGRWLNLYAADLGRGPDGQWWVLSDRVQAPSGLGYALENRLNLSRAFQAIYRDMNVRRLAPFFQAFRGGLAALASRSDPRICLYTPGPYSETYYEQAYLARYLGFVLVEGADLVARDGLTHVRTIAGLKRADVIWRRIDADFADPLELKSGSQLGVPGLVETIRQGNVAVANALGSGVAETAALLGFIPALAGRLLGEKLLLPNIATWWCGQAREREHVLSRLQDMVVAPAFGAASTRAFLDRSVVAGELSAEPARAPRRGDPRARRRFVGQEMASLSTTPVWVGSSSNRARSCCACSRRWAPTASSTLCPAVSAAFPTGSTPAPSPWARACRPPMSGSFPTAGGEPEPAAGERKRLVRRIMGNLPSRAADNLFWLGRYLERAEATLRLIRALGGA